MDKFLRIGSLLLIVSVMLVFISCDESDDEPTNAELIAGVWEYDTSSVSIKINDVDIIEYLIDLLELTEEEAEEFAELYGAGFDVFATGTWTLNADGTFEVEIDDETSTGTWSLSADGKTLSITEDGVTETIEVKTLTENKLEFYMDESLEEDFDEDGTDDTIDIEVSLTLKR